MQSQVKDGDTLILFDEGKPKQMILVQDGQTFQNKSGAYHHNTLIGKPYGTKIWSKSNQGYIQLLQPDPFLITETVPHKTQILFQMDISLILYKLAIKPGSKVVESGTGSGSLSSSFANVVADQGRLFTFEFNEDRAINGQNLLRSLEYHNSTVFFRDVYSNGFVKIENDHVFNENKEFPQQVDAIFLDLPQPWQALPHAKKVIKKNGRICCFSPCIEQVQKTVAQMKIEGWKKFETIECLKRQFERKEKTDVLLFENLKRKSDQALEGEQEPCKKVSSEQGIKSKQVYYSAGVHTAYGHTGYLTFAIMP